MRLYKAVPIVASLILALPAFFAAAAQIEAQPVPMTAPQSVEPPQDAAQAGAPTLHITTREIVVDVEVTDANGNPVHGLKQSDFAIKENGKPQHIRSFREFSASIPAPEHAQPDLPFGVYTNYQSIPASGPVNILLLDALHSHYIDITRTLQAASDYLSAMPKGTKVAIFWLSESGLHMLQGFTSDRASLLRAAHNNRIDVGSNLDYHTIQWYTIDALNQIAAYVSGIKGKKNLLWLTPGMPVDLMRDGGYGWSVGGGESSDMTMVHRLMDVYERFTAEQIAVDPIGSGGLAMSSFNPQGFQRQGNTLLKAIEVAGDSGGEAFFNTNDLKTAIATAIDHGSQFYTLSYIPPRQKDDGHYHHIKVEIVDQPGLHLVFRQGYNAERVPTTDAPAPGPALLKASLEGTAPAATQILFDAGVWPSPPPAANPVNPQAKKVKFQTKGPIPYEVHYGFPASEIAFTEETDGMLNGSLEFDIAAYNDLRKQVGHQSQTVTFHMSIADYDDFMSKPYRYTQKIALPLGQLSFHVGILDNVTSKVGTLEIPLIVRPYNNKAAQRTVLAPE